MKRFFLIIALMSGMSVSAGAMPNIDWVQAKKIALKLSGRGGVMPSPAEQKEFSNVLTQYKIHKDLLVQKLKDGQLTKEDLSSLGMLATALKWATIFDLSVE